MSIPLPLELTGKTAISRRKLSAPARWLYNEGLLDGRPALDYGCGRGKDAKVLGFEAWDPYWTPDKAHPKKHYHVILCTYVLNVIPSAEADTILGRLQMLLSPPGAAYVTVRRDMPHDYVTSSGLVQRLVHLDLPVVHETRGFCIYQVER